MTTRRSIALAMVVVASVLAFASLPAIWLNRQLLNTDNYTKTSSELLADPVIRDQVAVYLVDQLYQNVDVAGELRSALPAQLQPLAGTAASGVQTTTERAADAGGAGFEGHPRPPARPAGMGRREPVLPPGAARHPQRRWDGGQRPE